MMVYTGFNEEENCSIKFKKHELLMEATAYFESKARASGVLWANKIAEVRDRYVSDIIKKIPAKQRGNYDVNDIIAAYQYSLENYKSIWG